jgi:hypothetical protein
LPVEGTPIDNLLTKMSTKSINQLVNLCEKKANKLKLKGWRQKDFARALKKELTGRGN